MTYRDLLIKLQEMTNEQLDSTLTVEDGSANECYRGELRICGTEHDSLDENHPVIYFQ